MSFDLSNSFKSVYISGPISGNRKFREDFDRAEQYLKGFDGVKILNPANIPEPPLESSNRWGYFMRNSLRLLSNADIIFMLEGWQQSKGAELEHRIALELGMEVWYENNKLKKETTTKIQEPYTKNDLEHFKVSAKLSGWDIVEINCDSRCITLLKREFPTKKDLLYD